MDLSVTRENVRVSETLLDTVSDHPVDCDIILPDYCPDIARILKTEGCASIDQKVLESNRLTVNGTFSVKVIYIPENSHAIRCVTHEMPFSHSFEVHDAGEKAYARASARIVFVNCRPMGPRRLSIRGSIAVAAKIKGEREESFVTSIDDDRVQSLRKQVRAGAFVGACDKVFDVREELELAYGKPAAASIIKADAVVIVQDYKLISNKIIAKGEVLLKTLYAVESDDETGGQLEVMEHSIPISQILDLTGIDEECICELKFTASSVKVEVKADADGENRLLDVSLTVSAAAGAFRRQEFSTISDAYSPQFDMQLEHKNLSFEDVVDTVKINEMVKQTIEITEASLNSVTDTGVTAVITNVNFQGNTVQLSGDMNISIIAMDTGGGPVCIEKMMPFTLNGELKSMGDNMRCEPEIKIISSGYTLMGLDRIDMRIECSVEATIYSVVSEMAVVDLNLDDTKPKTCEPGKTLTLYFADSGEKLWDIAKRYNTSMEAVKQENSLEVDILEERSMLLIPRKRCARK